MRADRGTVYSSSAATPEAAEPGKGYVYVAAKKGDGPIKVGMATNARRRLQDLENANGQRFPLIWISPACTDFRAVEQLVHQHMRPARLLGEWFDMPFDLAILMTKDVWSGRKLSRTRFSQRVA